MIQRPPNEKIDTKNLIDGNKASYHNTSTHWCSASCSSQVRSDQFRLPLIEVATTVKLEIRYVLCWSSSFAS